MTVTIFISSGIILERKNNCQWKTDSTITGETIMAVTVGIGVGKGEQTSIRKIYTAFEKHNNGRGIHFHFMLSIISYITKCE